MEKDSDKESLDLYNDDGFFKASAEMHTEV